MRGNNTFQRAGGKEGTGASYNYNLNYTSNMSRRRRGGRDGITFVNGQRIEAIGGDGGDGGSGPNNDACGVTCPTRALHFSPIMSDAEQEQAVSKKQRFRKDKRAFWASLVRVWR